MPLRNRARSLGIPRRAHLPHTTTRLANNLNSDPKQTPSLTITAMKQAPLLLASLGGSIASGNTPPLNVTAISSRHGYSVLECWQLSSTPAEYMSAANYAVGNTTVATWSRIEPRTTVGEAWAPHVQ